MVALYRKIRAALAFLDEGQGVMSFRKPGVDLNRFLGFATGKLQVSSFQVGQGKVVPRSGVFLVLDDDFLETINLGLVLLCIGMDVSNKPRPYGIPGFDGQRSVKLLLGLCDPPELKVNHSEIVVGLEVFGIGCKSGFRSMHLFLKVIPVLTVGDGWRTDREVQPGLKKQ